MNFRVAQILLPLALRFSILSIHSSSPPQPELQSTQAGCAEELSGGDTTVFDTGLKAFGFPATNLREEHRASFFIGHSFFNQNWVTAPASTSGRDGLGPLFNARSCGACHFRDGRAQPPANGDPLVTTVLRISVPGTGEHNSPKPDPVYGGQIQGKSVPGVPPEADVYVSYEELPGAFGDGQPFSLRKPAYSIRNPAYGPLSTNLLISPRIAPHMVGLGLLEAVPEESLRKLMDEQLRSGTAVAGHLNFVWDPVAGKKVIGRFGWKAEQPSVLHQTAGAFDEDIGITSSIVPCENYTSKQELCAKQPSGGTPEISDKILHDVALYSRTLAVPARRDCLDPEVKKGEALFNSIGCAVCHVPKLQTGVSPDLPELSHQTIRPYTDLLLHDMGEGLADNRPVFEATGRDWRTPPLWGIGLISKVNGHTFFLHDGRARNFLEAILWHGGEANFSTERFRQLPRMDRQALLAFLASL